MHVLIERLILAQRTNKKISIIGDKFRKELNDLLSFLLNFILMCSFPNILFITGYISVALFPPLPNVRAYVDDRYDFLLRQVSLDIFETKKCLTNECEIYLWYTNLDSKDFILISYTQENRSKENLSLAFNLTLRVNY